MECIKLFLFLIPNGLNVAVIFHGMRRRSGDRITVAEVLGYGYSTTHTQRAGTPSTFSTRQWLQECKPRVIIVTRASVTAALRSRRRRRRARHSKVALPSEFTRNTPS